MTPKEKTEKIVMLTPTQEAMQWVWEQRKSTNSKDAISALDAVYQHLQKVTLEKEKEMLAGVWLDAQVAYQGDEYIKPSDPTFDEYYEETFNTNQENLQDSTNGYTYYPQEYKTVFNTKKK